MPKITRDIIESYIACHYKAHLTFLGLHQTSAGDASLLEDGVVGHQRTSERFIQSAELNKHSDNSIKLTSDYLRQGQPAISNGVYETDTLSLYFDGLRRVPGRVLSNQWQGEFCRCSIDVVGGKLVASPISSAFDTTQGESGQTNGATGC